MQGRAGCNCPEDQPEEDAWDWGAGRRNLADRGERLAYVDADHSTLQMQNRQSTNKNCRRRPVRSYGRALHCRVTLEIQGDERR